MCACPVEDRNDNGYPPRSHECMSNQTEFANSHEDTQLDIERKEKNIGHRRTMKMWKNVIEHLWNKPPIQEVRKLIDRQPKMMQAIIDVEGDRTHY